MAQGVTGPIGKNQRYKLNSLPIPRHPLHLNEYDLISPFISSIPPLLNHPPPPILPNPSLPSQQKSRRTSLSSSRQLKNAERASSRLGSKPATLRTSRCPTYARPPRCSTLFHRSSRPTGTCTTRTRTELQPDRPDHAITPKVLFRLIKIGWLTLPKVSRCFGPVEFAMLKEYNDLP